MVESKKTDAQFVHGSSISFTGWIVDIMVWINDVTCKWGYIFMLLQYCNAITWKAGPRWCMLTGRIRQ